MIRIVVVSKDRGISRVIMVDVWTTVRNLFLGGRKKIQRTYQQFFHLHNVAMNLSALLSWELPHYLEQRPREEIKTSMLSCTTI
jgi:hypothetical protein